MADIIPFNQERRFSLDDARSVLPVVRRVTDRAVAEYRHVRSRLENGLLNRDQTQKIENELHELITSWVTSVRKLGGEARGLWIVDLDAGDGYFCWKYPEEDVLFHHGYDQGFAAREPLVNRSGPIELRRRDDA